LRYDRIGPFIQVEKGIVSRVARVSAISVFVHPGGKIELIRVNGEP
jgi:hypothetical protein